jgi:hypothetical protein
VTGAGSTSLTIPIDAWVAAEYVSANAQAALDLYRDLTGPLNSVERLMITSGEAYPLEPDSADVTTSVHFAVDECSVVVRMAVTALLTRAGTGRLASIQTVIVSRWSGSEEQLDDVDAVDAFVLGLSLLEPAALAERALQSALDALGVKIRVVVSDLARLNPHEVLRVAAEPGMDSPNASPLNPFALIGVAGDEAMLWESRGFSASAAEPWVREHFKPAAADDWSAYGFSAEVAASWRTADVPSHVAAELHNAGVNPELVDDAWTNGVGLDSLMALAGVVSIEDMPGWVEALEEHEMIDSYDVHYLVKQGVTPDRLLLVPWGSTAVQAVRYLREELGD